MLQSPLFKNHQTPANRKASNTHKKCYFHVVPSSGCHVNVKSWCVTVMATVDSAAMEKFEYTKKNPTTLQTKPK